MTATVAITQPPTPQPTALPTTGTSAPTAVNVFPYTTGTLTDTNNALQNTVPVQQSACAGESFVFSTCSYDSGDTLIRLYLGGVQLAQAFENTYNSNTNNYCSVITYTYTDASCGTLVLQLGCSGSTTCSMTATVAITTPTPSAPPTAQPSNPTPAPSTTRPTTANTFPFTTSRSNTNNALQNTAPVQQTACAGDVLLFSTCSQDGGYDIGRTYLRLYNGAQVASANDNAINPSNQPCSQILYTHTGSCTTLVLQLGCSATTSCTMKATVTITYGLTPLPSATPTQSSAIPTHQSSAIPTRSAAPTPPATPAPTLRTTFSPSTTQPTAAPSTTQPTAAPSTTQPTAAPTPQPTPAPSTAKPSQLPTAAPSINDLVKFSAVQPISGVSVSEYQASRALYNTTLQSSIAASMVGIVSADIIDLDISATRRLRTSPSTPTSHTPTPDSTTSTLTYVVAVRDASLSYTTLNAQLTKSVMDGTFNSLLNDYATALGATGLESAASSSVTTQNLEPVEGGGGSSGGLDGAAIGGIAVAIVVIAALMALCAYFAYHRQGKVQALLDVQSASVQAPGVELNTLNPVLKGKIIEEMPKSQDVSEIARRWDPRW